MAKLFAQFVHDQSGATAIEYGMLAVGVAVAIVVAVLALGGTLTETYQSVDTAMQ